jgi:hypothetical protein
LNAVEGFVAPGGVNPAGYTGCTDVDECLISDICGPDVGCTNTVGSYVCDDEPDPTEGPDPTGPSGGTDPTDNCAGLGGICDHAACDDEVEYDCGRTVCNMSCTNGEAINVSSVTCVDTGKLKKQGWRVGKKKLAANAPINCGNLNRSFCGIEDLNAHFGVGNNYVFNCDPNKSKCKPSCAGGGKTSPKKLKCKNGKLNTSRISGC